MILRLKVLSLVLGFYLCSTPMNVQAAEALRKTKSAFEERVEAMFEPSKAICVGRFLIDVPREAEVVYGPAWVLADIERYANEAKKLEIAVKEALDQVEQDRSLAIDEMAGENSMLGKVVELGPSRIVFSKGSGSAYSLVAYVPLSDDLYTISLTSWERGKQHDDLSQLIEIVSQITQRPPNVIPSSPGVCVDGAFVADSGKRRPERVTVGLRMPTFKDVHFSIATTLKEHLVESDGIELRLRSAEADAKARGAATWFASNKLIRRGKRNVDGWSGYEILARKSPQKHEGASHEFAFTSHGEPNNPMRPVLELELHSGVLGNRRGGSSPSITDAEAVLLWDRLLGSIRPRPVSKPK